MMKLHTAKPAFGLRCASPFGTKADALLRLAGVDAERVFAFPQDGPREKLPFLVLDDGSAISDTRNIQRHLEREHGLTLAPCPHDTLVCRTAEEHLYFAIMRVRWEHHFERVRDELFAPVPGVMRGLVAGHVRRRVTRDLWGQGMGRRPEEEMLALVDDDFAALAEALDGRRFFGGEALALADLAAYAILDQVFGSELHDPLTERAVEHRALVTYHRRVDERLFASEGAAFRRAS